jgi:hypothetical protein
MLKDWLSAASLLRPKNFWRAGEFWDFFFFLGFTQGLVLKHIEKLYQSGFHILSFNNTVY